MTHEYLDAEIVKWEEEWRQAHPCPTCGGPTFHDPDCPGWGKPVMVCGSGRGSRTCGNANYYYCLDKTCGWWFRYPNNRMTNQWDIHLKRQVEMGPEPSWLDDAEKALTLNFDSDQDW